MSVFAVLLIGLTQGGSASAPAKFLRFERIETARGLEILYKPRPGSGTVHVRVVVRVGARSEPRRLNGVSHLLEHMVFSTPCGPGRNSLRRTFDLLGAKHNGATGPDSTLFYFESSTGRFADGFRYLAQCLSAPALSSEAIEAEKKIVIEEMGGRKSRLAKKLMKLTRTDSFWPRLRKQLFPGDPISRPIVGAAEKVLRIGPEDLWRHHKRYYSPGNTTVVVVGDVGRAQVVRAAEWLYPAQEGGGGGSFKVRGPPPLPKGAVSAYQNTAEYPPRVCIYRGFRTGPYTPSHVAKFLVLQQLARTHLEIELREKRKLAYWHSVYYRQRRSLGYMYAKAEVAPENRTIADRILADEFRRLREGRFDEEGVRAAAEQVRTALLLSCQSNSGMAAFLALHAGLAPHTRESLAALPDLVSSVRREDLVDLAQRHIRREGSFRAVVATVPGLRILICVGVGLLFAAALVLVLWARRSLAQKSGADTASDA